MWRNTNPAQAGAKRSAQIVQRPGFLELDGLIERQLGMRPAAITALPVSKNQIAAAALADTVDNLHGEV